jgi:hypothetical protein
MYVPKRLKDTGGREKQMRSKHHNAKESERKDARRRRVLGCVGGRSVCGRGRWKSEELQMMYGAENPLGFTSLGFGSDGSANLGTRMA